MSEVSYRILGALGPDPGSPLLAEAVISDLVWERVVLSRPAPAEVSSTLRRLHMSPIVAARRVLTTANGPFGLVDWIPGMDLDEMRAAHGGPMDVDLVCFVLREVVEALQIARSAGHGHGALDASQVRVTPGGAVRILGFRGGDERGDALAVHRLACALAETDDGDLPPRFEAASWPDQLEPLQALLSGPEVDLAVHVPDRPPQVHRHALAGQVFSERSASAASAPPKVQIAAVGAITLVLGLGAGWALSGWGADIASGDGSDAVEMECAVPGDLDETAAGRYLCVRTEGGLRCSDR